jgi:hypothetical protein
LKFKGKQIGFNQNHQTKTKMRLKLLVLLLVSNCGFLAAQTNGNQGVINGKVIDKNTKQPVPYVNVAVMEDNKIITGGLTQENGNFTIKGLALKKYTIEIQFIGYKGSIRFHCYVVSGI